MKRFMLALILSGTPVMVSQVGSGSVTYKAVPVPTDLPVVCAPITAPTFNSKTCKLVGDLVAMNSAAVDAVLTANSVEYKDSFGVVKFPR